MFVLYVYVPTLAETEIRALLQSLAYAGFIVTHLGKNDPPRKWSGSRDEAIAPFLARSVAKRPSHKSTPLMAAPVKA